MSGRDPNRFPHTGPLWDGPIYPGNGYPPNPGQDRPGGSPFGRLAKGQGLGKKCVLVYDAAVETPQPSPVSMLTVEGDDLDAQQMIVTLAAPLVVALPFAEVLERLDDQNTTGELDNQQIALLPTFPGTAVPLKWPPLEAIVEWGTGGTSARAVIDYVNGVTFSVVASFLRVFAIVTQSSALIGGTSAAYVLSAFAGPGFSRSTAQRSVHLGTVVSGVESGVFAIPRFARRAYLVGGTNGTPPVTTAAFVRFWQSQDGEPGGNNVGDIFVSGNQPQAFDIPSGAMYFSVFSESGSNQQVAVIFELALS